MASNETFRRVLCSALTPRGREEETGTRTKATLIFPNMSIETQQEVEKTLVSRFCGYSMSEGCGGWRDPESGERDVEWHYSYVVSYFSSRAQDAWIKDFAEYVGRLSGQTWMHVEFSSFEAGHVKVRK